MKELLHSAIQYIPFHNALIYFPLRVARNGVSGVYGTFAGIVGHTFVIPLLLTFQVVIYSPLLRYPLVEPLIWLLELHDSGENLQNYEWMKQQIGLFYITALHFILVAVYTGVFVGFMVGFNFRIVRFLFDLFISKPEPAKPVSTKQARTQQATPYLDAYLKKSGLSTSYSTVDSGNAVPTTKVPSVKEPMSPPYSPQSDLVGAESTISTGIETHTLQRIKDRFGKKDQFVGEDGLQIYDDDDGYGYSGVKESEPEAGPRIDAIAEEDEGEEESKNDDAGNTEVFSDGNTDADDTLASSKQSTYKNK